MRPGGRYGYGELLARGKWWSIYVPPRPKPIAYLSDEVYLTSWPPPPWEQEGWKTTAHIQGITRLPGNPLEDIAVGLAIRTRRDLGYSIPAELEAYQTFEFDEWKVAEGETSLQPLNVSLPAQNFYDAAADALQLISDIAQIADFRNRAYKIILQEANRDEERRAIVQTFFIYQDFFGYHIVPRYLIVNPRGYFEEISFP